MIRHFFLILIVIGTSLNITNGQSRTNPKEQPKELGKVSWYRDYDRALKQATVTGKPVLILFQEVPGCSTCKNYGKNVLSNPLMTEIIENEFIPLAIYNNKGGKDREILDKYTESAWNNPVVNIVDQNGKKLIQRVAGNYTKKGLFTAMKEALNLYKKPVPKYMELLGKELGVYQVNLKTNYYSMYCFWTGEKELGGQEGVLETEAGFMNGHEVVKVTFDTDKTTNDQLDKFAQSKTMQPIKKDASYRTSPKDQDYYLKNSDYRYLPLTKLQRTKINSALGYQQNPTVYLSPKQIKWLKDKKLKKGKKILFHKNFEESWNRLDI